MALSPDQLQQQLELYQQVIKTQWAIVGSTVTVVLIMIGILNKGFMKRLDKIDGHLDPLLKTIERHDVEIINIKVDIEELKGWQGVHNDAIQRIERHPSLRV